MQQEMEYVYEVYKEKNFTRAAEKLFITQPALSMAIQKVEERLGMPLFDRSTRPLSLTEAGEAYIEHIRRVRHMETELEQQIQDIRDLNTGTITIGGSHYLNSCILPPILSRFLGKYPGIEIRIEEASSAELADRLSRQMIDLTFSCSPGFIQDFERTPAFTDHILLAVPKAMDRDPGRIPKSLTAEDILTGRHLEKDCPSVSLREFAEFPFILLSEGNNLHDRSREMFEEAGVQPRVRMVLSQLATAYHFADAGIGAAFVSDRLTMPHMNGVNYYRLDSELTTRQFYLLLPKRRYISAAVQRFMECFV